MDPKSLIHRYLLGDITEPEAKELDRLLASDVKLRREFVLAAATDAGLREVAFERSIDSVQNDIEVDEAARLSTRSPISDEVGYGRRGTASRLRRAADWFVTGGRGSRQANAKLGGSLALPHGDSAGKFQPVDRRTTSKWIVLACFAATTLFAVSFLPSLSKPTSIATLASCENAAWESSLPTTPGSMLLPGTLKLITGIATIRFDSGAEVMMEAPANIELISSMRGKLVNGAAVVSVPEPAIGFVLETPDGYVVDHGTQFAVNVTHDGKHSDFEVIEGEISVHLRSTGEQVRLNDRQFASIAMQKLTTFEDELPVNELSTAPQILRVGTNGRAGSVIRNNKRNKRIVPTQLMAKQGGAGGNWDLRSFFAFELSNVDFDSTESVRLRLNLVPSGIGFATRLPEMNRFAIYGMTNKAKEDWQIECLWDDSPGPEDGVLLGTFEIPRSVQRGSFGIQTDELLNFLKADRTGSATLVLVRETGQIHGDGPGLVHAFATDAHPEASGPCLEFSLK